MTKVNLSDITWGPVDANEPDDDFLNKFIEPSPIEQLFRPEYWIISGEKGSGKSAVRQALLQKQKYRQEFSAVADISFDDVEFTAIVRELAELSQITGIQGLTLLTGYWRYCLVIESIIAFLKSETGNKAEGVGVLKSYISHHGGSSTTFLGRILDRIEDAWTILDDKTSPTHGRNQRKSVLPGSLTAKIIETIRQHPNGTTSFVTVESQFADILRKCGGKLLVILDGFDTIKNADTIRSKVNLIFESLATAVYGLSIDNKLGKVIQIKAIIPNDRYLTMDLRDLDKIDNKHRSIRWNYPSLKQFLARRIQLHPKLSSYSSFEELWECVMPTTVLNPYYKIEENTFDYILRHTMYRPRQLQIHLERLSRAYPSMSIEPNMLPRIVRESCKSVATFFFKEYELDHPNLERLLVSRFKGKPNVLPFSEFRDIIATSLRQYQVDGITVEEKIDILYTIGFFGVINEMADFEEASHAGDRYFPPRKATIKPYRVDFYYTNRIPKITHSLRDDTLITMHPTFVDHADMTPFPDIIIG